MLNSYRADLLRMKTGVSWRQCSAYCHTEYKQALYQKYYRSLKKQIMWALIIILLSLKWMPMNHMQYRSSAENYSWIFKLLFSGYLGSKLLSDKMQFDTIAYVIVFSFVQAGRKERSSTLNTAIDNMCKKTRDLRRQVRGQRHGDWKKQKSKLLFTTKTFISCFCSLQINLKQERTLEYR